MDEESKKEIKKLWVNIATYYEKILKDEQLAMYVYDCKEFSLGDLRKAFEVYRNGDKGMFFPLPPVLKRIARPPVIEIDESQTVPTKIFEAIAMFGYTNGQSAREFMGPLAWECVQAFGGWNHLCTSTNLGGEGVVRAQLRDTARAKMNRAKTGRAQLKPGEGIKELENAPLKSLSGSNSNEKIMSVVSDTLDGKKPV